MNDFPTGDKHKEFAEVLSHKSISLLPYQTIDDVPTKIKEPLLVHQLYRYSTIW